MLEELLKLIEQKEIEQYVRLLLSGVRDGRIGLRSLTELIDLLNAREAALAQDDSAHEEWAYMSAEDVANSCAFFAFALLKKGLLDGRWCFENGALTDGAETVPLGEVVDPAPKEDWEFSDLIHIRSRLFRDILHFDREKEAFLLAPLDRCTEENALAVFNLIESMKESRMFSLARLREAEYIRPERLTRGELLEAIARDCHTTYCYFFLEQANEQELAEEGSAYAKVHNAKTAAEAVLAQTERDFWLMQGLTFPYTAWLLLTGQLTELPFREGDAD